MVTVGLVGLPISSRLKFRTISFAYQFREIFKDAWSSGLLWEGSLFFDEVDKNDYANIWASDGDSEDIWLGWLQMHLSYLLTVPSCCTFPMSFKLLEYSAAFSATSSASCGRRPGNRLASKTVASEVVAPAVVTSVKAAGSSGCDTVWISALRLMVCTTSRQ